ncbi:MAG TPA: serine hydrolase domain-containing protein [Woeseiaceae bacterium]|nr:serine hydrolase domain-containing protein [Woeseiaceae bacterium]
MKSLFRPGTLFLAMLLGLGVLHAGIAGADDTPSVDAGFSTARLARVDRGIESAIAEQQIAGAVALIQRHGKTVYFKASGDAGPGKAMRTDTLFRIASMTKPITSTAVMMLFEEGRFLLDDPIGRYLPEFDRDMQVVRHTAEGYELDPAKGPITIRQLLTHTSGISYRFMAEPPLDKVYADANVDDGIGKGSQDLGAAIAALATLPLAHHPGEGWTYGLSTDVLGRLVEVLAGQPFGEFLAERIFTPLGMHDTYFSVPQSRQGRISAVYRQDASGRLVRIRDGKQDDGQEEFSVDAPYSGDNPYQSGGAGLVSSAADYARFAQMILNGGELDGRRLLGRKTVELMTSDQIGRYGISSFDGQGFALGFSSDGGPAASGAIGSPGVIGWSGYYNTTFWIDPEEQLVAVLMTQRYPFGIDLLEKFRVLVYQAIID